MADLGKWNTLVAVQESDHGMLLEAGELGLILAPWKYLPEDAEPGEEFRVFVYLDSEDRPIATTEEPLAEVGQFANLEVVGVNQNIGAFLSWGLTKDLLLPFREMLGRPRVGQKVLVAIIEDRKSRRIIGSMRTHRHIRKSEPPYSEGEPVKLLIAEKTPLGFNAIINHTHMGLLYQSELENFPVQIGQPIDGFIKKIREEGKIDLTVHESGYQRVASLTEDILEALKNNQGTLNLGDKSPPEDIRKTFGVSKKAFKQAVGALYKERKINMEGNAIRLVQ